tara:strand:+ start:108 stop:434 length:327 start_codon:yes stop_codon:yes gene_type:complete
MGKRSRRMRSPKFQKKFATKLGNLRAAITNTAETIVEEVAEKVEEIIEEVVEKKPNALRTLETTEPPVAELRPEPKKAKAKTTRTPRKARTPRKPRASTAKKTATTKE